MVPKINWLRYLSAGMHHIDLANMKFGAVHGSGTGSRIAVGLFLILLFSFVDLHSEGLGQFTGFTENKGQIVDQNRNPNKNVLFLFNSKGMNVQLRRAGFSYDVWTDESTQDKERLLPGKLPVTGDDIIFKHKPIPRHFHRVDIDLEGADLNHRVVAEEKSEAYFNYYLYNEPVLNVHKYNKVTYTDVYPGIDLVFSAGNGKPFEYTFVLRPGALMSDIRLKVSGADSVMVNDDAVLYATSLSLIRESIPRCWYSVNSQETDIKVCFSQTEINTFGFESNQSVPAGALVFIDPYPSRVWGTYFGGEGFDYNIVSKGDLLDNFGNLILSGNTSSIEGIATTGSFLPTYQYTGTGGFITKFSQSGNQIWGTYTTGVAGGYTTDLDGNIIQCGLAVNGSSIMITPGAWQTTSTSQDGYIAKFNNNGFLLWGTYFGGTTPASPVNNFDYLISVTTDNFGNIYSVGHTSSTSGLATPRAFQTSYGGGKDAFMVKFTPDGQLSWATYYGGDQEDGAGCISVTGNGLIYFTGSTYSANNIATSGSFMSTYSGSSYNGFLACFSSDGSRNWCTYLGRGAGACHVDTINCVFVTGYNDLSNTIGTPGTFLSSPPYPDATFLAKFDNLGNRIWGTYFGRVNFIGITNDSLNNLYLAGSSYIQDNIGVSQDAYQSSIRGQSDAYIGKFNGDGQFIWGTYYGGTNYENGNSCDYDQYGNIYLSGETLSLNYPSSSTCFQSFSNNMIATNKAHSTENQGDWDYFLVKFKMCQTPDTASEIYGPDRFCANSTGHVFSIDSIPFADTLTWCVSNGLTITAGQGTNSITVDAGSVPGYDTVAVYGTNSCGDGFAKLKIVMIASPHPTLSGPDTVCRYSQGIYSTESGMNNYYWTTSTGGNIVSGGGGTDYSCSVKWSVPGIHWVKVSYTDNEGCPAIDTALITVTVPEFWAISVNVVQQGTACEGNAVVMIALPVNGGLNPGYDWFVNGVRVFSGGDVFTYLPVQGDIITCRLTSSYSLCTQNNPALSDPVVVDIFPLPAPKPIKHE